MKICHRCEGDGKAHGADRPFEWPLYPGLCPVCKGTGFEMIEKPLVICYTNWKSETAIRRIIPLSVWFGSTQWHPEPQWLMDAQDVDKDCEMRTFAFQGIKWIGGAMFIIEILNCRSEEVQIDGHKFRTSTEGVIECPLGTGVHTLLAKGKAVDFSIQQEGEKITVNLDD